MASGTSRALPWPKPTRPFWSPTTTSAAKPKRRPPLTTLATRLMWTSLSTNSLSRSSRSRPRSRPPSLRSCAISCPCSFPEARVEFASPIGLAAKIGLLPAQSWMKSQQTFRPGQQLEVQAGLARGVGQRLDAAVIDVRPTIEDDFLAAGLGGALGDELADSGGSGGVGAGLQRTLQVLLQARSRGDGVALGVVDDLRVDVLRRTIDRQ